MNMIENHMEQVALSAAGIADLPFPPPKIFTNALLQPHDITALIRDTEAHERALFTVGPSDTGDFGSMARKSAFFDTSSFSKPGDRTYSGLKPTSAVRRILGGNLMEQIRHSEKAERLERGDVDVEALLKGAERLCAIYPIPGAAEKIESLRSRHDKLAASIAEYEAKVASQASQLDKISHARNEDEGHEFGMGDESEGLGGSPGYTTDDLRREENEIRELEEKKKVLEDRVNGMERDLGGLMR